MNFFCSACFLIRIVFVKLLKDIVTNTAWSKHYKKQYKYKDELKIYDYDNMSSFPKK